MLPRAPVFELVRRGWHAPIAPLTLTFSVTAACQGRCRTCRIGRRFEAQPDLVERDLRLEEIERIFTSLGSMGRVLFFNVSGGEPFLRDDLPRIVRSACRHLRPSLIHIPTNALEPERIARLAVDILDVMATELGPDVPLSIKPSVDGIGQDQDRIRGVAGSFAALERSLDALLALSRREPRLHVDLGTVISTENLERIDAIGEWVHGRGIQSYRHEIAEQRSELHNLGDPITPEVEDYARAAQGFARRIRAHIRGKAPLTLATEAVRLVYYDLAAQILREGRQVTPCYAGVSNIHLAQDGEVWPCCVLGSRQSMGRVQAFDYDLPALLRSERARRVRRFIAAGRCACPLANQWLSNILLTPRHMLRAISVYLSFFLRT